MRSRLTGSATSGDLAYGALRRRNDDETDESDSQEGRRALHTLILAPERCFVNVGRIGARKGQKFTAGGTSNHSRNDQYRAPFESNIRGRGRSVESRSDPPNGGMRPPLRGLRAAAATSSLRARFDNREGTRAPAALGLALEGRDACVRRKARCGNESRRVDSGGESRLARLVARNTRYEAALARGRILAYLDERSLENELEGPPPGALPRSTIKPPSFGNGSRLCGDVGPPQRSALGSGIPSPLGGPLS
jgi:hypothetical protein